MSQPDPTCARARRAAAILSLLAAVQLIRAGDLDTIGVIVLRQADSSLNGNGISVAHVEAPTSNDNPPPFEVNPAFVGQPATLFEYASSNGSAGTFPNTVGSESGHADSVAWNFYGTLNGVARQVGHVENYEANYFYDSIISTPVPPAIGSRVVNQSFIFDSLSASEQIVVEENYDYYAANHNTLFVSGAGNSGQVAPAATSYNGIGVGVYGAPSATGPTLDGRSKPDITAPGGATSFSTPYVSGAAAVLLQAAMRGDGGPDTASASDLLSLKALLLNGAVKPLGWTNGTATPLDFRYGAGILNVFNSWNQLQSGRHGYIESTANSIGTPHPPGTSGGNVPALAGWDFNSLTNAFAPPSFKEEVNHYYFDLPPLAGQTYTATATLAWNRQAGQVAINDLNLFLYNAATAALVACSTSAVDNVEHIFLPSLPAGRYDLQVQKDALHRVSSAETYALAFEFFNLELKAVSTNGSVEVSWPLAPSGFLLESTGSLNPAVVWLPAGAPVTVAGGRNLVVLPATNSAQFFRLQRP